MLLHKWASNRKFLLSPFHVAFCMLRFYGYWPSRNWPKHQKIIYNCYTILSTCIIGSLICGVLLHILIVTKDIKSLLECCFMLFSGIDLYVKAISFLQHRKEYRELVLMIMEDNGKIKSFGAKKILKKYHREYLIISYSAMVGGFLYIVSIMTFSLMRNSLPFKVWIPFLRTNVAVYAVAYIYTSISLLFAVIVLLSHNIIAAGIAMKICAELDMLQHRFANISGKNKNMRYIEFSKSIRRHVFITKLASDFQNMTYATNTSQNIVLVGNLCIGALLLTRVSMFSLDFLLYLDFTTTTIIPSMLYYWYGDQITEKSFDIGNVVYGINWIDFDKSEAMAVINVIRYSAARPIILRTNLRVPLNLHTFSHMINMSYQIFTLLNSITVKNHT